jgi:voltage-dependent anion channel protein 2
LRKLTIIRFFYLDLLNDDFTNKYSLKCKKDAGKVGVTIETEADANFVLATKVGTKFSYAKFNVDKGQLKADGGGVLETSLAITPEVKLYFKANKGADLIVDYVKGGLYATGTVDVLNLTKVSSSACYSLPSGIKVGGDLTYGLSGSKSGVSGYTAGASYTHGPLFASLTAANKLSLYEIGLLYKVNKELTVASVTNHTSATACNVLAIGAAYKAPTIGTIKAKYGTDHVIHACVTREVAPKVSLTASASFSASDISTFKPGMSISM